MDIIRKRSDIMRVCARLLLLYLLTAIVAERKKEIGRREYIVLPYKYTGRPAEGVRERLRMNASI